jgi:NAD(P)H-hydrate epimerase
MAGAALLSGRAAYRSGAGLVRILTGESNRQILQTGLPDAVLSTYDDRDDLVNPDLIADLDQALEWADVIGIGPGLGLSARARIFLHKVLSEGRVPLVIDADGINNLAVMLKESREIRTLYKDYPYGIIMTPHPGEMCRLTGRPVRDIVTNLVDTASSFADENHVIVLKDARTVIAGGGPYIYLNRSGNSGMAVGGSGDVLTGMICGILGQYGPDSFSQDGGDRQAILVHAVRLAVYCHGMAGDLAAKEKGQRGLMASDLPDAAARIMDPGFDPDQGGTSLPGGRHTGKFLIENDGGGVFG